MLLRTLQAPPPKGSLQEWTLIFLLERLEDIEHARFRALAQLLIDQKTGAEAFEDYMKIAFPSMTARKEQSNNQVKQVLKDWTSKGPLKITPLTAPQGRSKLKQRLVRTQDKRMEQLYGKIRNG